VYLFILCWYLSSSVFQVFIENVYVSAMPGEVNNLHPIAAQQNTFLPTSFLELKQFERSGLSTVSFDMEAFREHISLYGTA